MMHGSSDRAHLWIRVFAAPGLLAAATIFGLLAALLWEKCGQYVAWVTVGAPLAVIAWVWGRRRSQKTGRFRRRCAANSARGRCAAISELLLCKTVAALVGVGDLLHTSRGAIPGFPPVWEQQRA
jgi:hypothetical protein